MAPQLQLANALPQSQSVVFDKLPAEIRNTIYSMVFSRNSTSKVVLSSANPPSKSIILTCKKAYSEAHKLYLAEYRLYWNSTRFTIPYKPDHAAISAIRNLNHQDIHNISTLTINCGTPRFDIQLTRPTLGSIWEARCSLGLATPRKMAVFFLCDNYLSEGDVVASIELAEHGDVTRVAQRQLTIMMDHCRANPGQGY